MSETVQYRVLRAKREAPLVSGPDDADIVFEVPIADALTDPTVAFMQGRLKPTGNTGAVFALLRSGEVAAQLAQLVASGG